MAVKAALPSAGAWRCAEHWGTAAQELLLTNRGMQPVLLKPPLAQNSRQPFAVDSTAQLKRWGQLQTQQNPSTDRPACDCPTRLSNASASVTAAIPLQIGTRIVDSLVGLFVPRFAHVSRSAERVHEFFPLISPLVAYRSPWTAPVTRVQFVGIWGGREITTRTAAGR